MSTITPTPPIPQPPVHTSPCVCCGAYPGSSLAESSAALFAVADVLVLRALETVGKRIVRAERRRFAQFGSRPFHEAHTVWRPDEDTVCKTLRGAWEIIPALLHNHHIPHTTARQVTEMLDLYVRDLLITGTRHTHDDLRYRFATQLGITYPALEELS